MWCAPLPTPGPAPDTGPAQKKLKHLRVDATSMQVSLPVAMARMGGGRPHAQRARRGRTQGRPRRTRFAAWRGVPLGPRLDLHVEGLRPPLHRLRRHAVDGAIGSSADNALAESFNASLKRELLAGAPAFADQASAYRTAFRWANRYNTRRRHSAIGNIAPNTYEAAYSTTLAEAA